jgi:hypothetical protein
LDELKQTVKLLGNVIGTKALNMDREVPYLQPMEQTVEIPVTIRGEERLFVAQVQAWRYGLRFLVDIDGNEVVLERDDAGEFRAIMPEGVAGKMPDKAVISAIIEVLEQL